MTGIERLRELIDSVDSTNTLWSITSREYDETNGLTSTSSPKLRDVLTSIADQISRKQADRSDEIAETFRREVSEAYEWVREHGADELTRALAIGRAISAWNRRAERTCHVVRTGEPSPTGVPRERRCSECGARLTRFGRYCPGCGARVVSSDGA